MEVDQIQCNLHTFINANATLTSSKQSHHPKMDPHYPDDKEEDGDRQQIPPPPVHLRGGVGRFYGWPSSRIVRVTRASGGKDRHSKVLTSKGLRDRRVRLSVNTAIQFYDLQDRLGYDQPSKALEWLLKAAATSIAELPPMNPPFPETPRQVRDEKRSSTGGSDEVGLDATADTGGQPLTYLTKSSSNSETSKPSGVSRSEHRMKARERARERAAEKDKDKDESEVHPNSQITSFTELLSGGGFNHETSNRQWSDYLTPQMQLLNSLKRNPFTLTGYFNSELQNLEFGMVNGDDENNGSYNLTFGISSAGVAGFNRGTLQSNLTSSSLLPPAPIVQTHHAHSFGSSSSSTGLLMGENQQPHEFQLFYAGQKGKGKD